MLNEQCRKFVLGNDGKLRVRAPHVTLPVGVLSGIRCCIITRLSKVIIYVTDFEQTYLW